ncbi:MAG: hypothetical protein SA339_12325 [Methanomassiliicoccus sp.]|nr:hypothetical protein [Methanomassiliicoccus sp.]
MSIRVVEPEVSFDMEGARVELQGYERAIDRPASEMIIVPNDLPTRWTEVPIKPSERLREEKVDYAVSRFALMDGRKESGKLSFEAMVYRNQRAAVEVLVKMLGKMTSLQLTRVDLGTAGAMMEVVGKAGRKMKAVAFVERNVFGLIMLSCDTESGVSDAWLLSMGRLMISRMH